MSAYEELKNRTDAHEARIIRAVARRAIEKGLVIIVNDGEEAEEPSADLDTILGHVGHTEETYFVLHWPNSSPSRAGSIWFVHGNGEDVVTDHTDNDLVCELVRF